MAFNKINTHCFLFISLSILVSFSVQAKRTLHVVGTTAPATASDAGSHGNAHAHVHAPATGDAAASAHAYAHAHAHAPGASKENTKSISGSPSLAPSQFDGYEEALDYVGSNTEESKNKITPIIHKIINEVKVKTAAIIKGTIETGLNDPKRSPAEKKCIGSCQLDYMDLRNDISEVLHDFAMTRNFEMVNDYLHGLSYDVQTCKDCRADTSLTDNVEYVNFEEWLTSLGKSSAEELKKAMHA